MACHNRIRENLEAKSPRKKILRVTVSLFVAIIIFGSIAPTSVDNALAESDTTKIKESSDSSSNDGEEGSNDGEEGSNDGEEGSNDGEEGSNDGEEGSNDDNINTQDGFGTIKLDISDNRESIAQTDKSTDEIEDTSHLFDDLSDGQRNPDDAIDQSVEPDVLKSGGVSNPITEGNNSDKTDNSESQSTEECADNHHSELVDQDFICVPDTNNDNNNNSTNMDSSKSSPAPFDSSKEILVPNDDKVSCTSGNHFDTIELVCVPDSKTDLGDILRTPCDVGTSSCPGDPPLPCIGWCPNSNPSPNPNPYPESPPPQCDASNPLNRCGQPPYDFNQPPPVVNTLGEGLKELFCKTFWIFECSKIGTVAPTFYPPEGSPAPRLPDGWRDDGRGTYCQKGTGKINNCIHVPVECWNEFDDPSHCKLITDTKDQGNTGKWIMRDDRCTAKGLTGYACIEYIRNIENNKPSTLAPNFGAGRDGEIGNCNAPVAGGPCANEYVNLPPKLYSPSYINNPFYGIATGLCGEVCGGLIDIAWNYVQWRTPGNGPGPAGGINSGTLSPTGRFQGDFPIPPVDPGPAHPPSRP